MEFETIATITRVTAKASLLLYCAAFLLDVSRVAPGKCKQAFAVFLSAHAVHLGFVGVYFYALREWPALDPVLALLGLGVASLIWLGVFGLRKTVATGEQVFAAPMAWFIWFLFGATHVSRLLDPERGSWVNAVFLAIVLGSGLARIWIGRLAYSQSEAL